MSNKYTKLVLLGILFFLLALVRIYENELFYDPFIAFFKQQYSTIASPNFNSTKLLSSVSFRYFLNSIISITILYVAFKDTGIIKFACIFYGISFCLLLALFTCILLHLNKTNYQLFFYVRRFLIQPIFILLLLPAFYYQRINKA